MVLRMKTFCDHAKHASKSIGPVAAPFDSQGLSSAACAAWRIMDIGACVHDSNRSNRFNNCYRRLT